LAPGVVIPGARRPVGASRRGKACGLARGIRPWGLDPVDRTDRPTSAPSAKRSARDATIRKHHFSVSVYTWVVRTLGLGERECRDRDSIAVKRIYEISSGG
jgi:hypothetical protein